MKMLRRLRANRYCPYDPINGPGRRPKRASILVVSRSGSQSVLVCADHLPKYINNNWRRG